MIYTDVTSTDEAATTEEAILREVQKVNARIGVIEMVLGVVLVMVLLLAVSVVAR